MLMLLSLCALTIHKATQQNIFYESKNQDCFYEIENSSYYWAIPWGNAIQGRPVEMAEQAPVHRPGSKNIVNLCCPQIGDLLKINSRKNRYYTLIRAERPEAIEYIILPPSAYPKTNTRYPAAGSFC